MNIYPVNLDIAGRHCLVVGGGGVAARKINGLLICGATVTVIAPKVKRSIALLVKTGEVEWHQRAYQRGDMVGAFLVFAATDNKEVQDLVISEAHDKGILLNAADAPTSCTFQVPARVRRDDFLVTVSTGGGSPALSSKIRKDLEGQFGPEYGIYVTLLAKIREQVVGDGNTTEAHKRVFNELLHLDLLSHIEQQNRIILQQKLRDVLPDEIDVDALLDSIYPQ